MVWRLETELEKQRRLESIQEIYMKFEEDPSLSQTEFFIENEKERNRSADERQVAKKMMMNKPNQLKLNI